MIPPFASHTRKGPERRAYKPQFRQKRKRSRSPAGPRRLGTATRISASLSRRLSAFFGSTHDQAPKAAKFAVLNPGHAGFPKRVKRSEGSDTTPASYTQNALRTEHKTATFPNYKQGYAAQRGCGAGGKRTHAVGVHPLPPAFACPNVR